MAELVYRYLSKEFGLLALQQRTWKVGRLLDLNDPLDCQPRLVRSADDGLPTDEDAEVGADPYFREIYDSFGVICYSAKITDPVVWSHYADSHRGIALGFRFRDGEGLLKMEYPEDNKRPQIEISKLNHLRTTNSQEALLKVVTNGFLQKAKSWAYENEFRHFISLNGCDMVGPHYFRGMPIDRLERVVLGVRCQVSEGDIHRVITNWQHHRQIVVSRAKIDTRSYNLIA